MDLPRGLYERVINEALRRELDSRDTGVLTFQQEPVRFEEAPAILAQYIAGVTQRALAQVKRSAGLPRQVEACNQMLRALDEWATDEDLFDVAPEAQRLLAVLDAGGLGPQELLRPTTPLSMGWLLTGTHLDPSLAGELQKELASADCVDILCSFIKWSGIRVLRQALEEFTGRDNARLRVITTSYMGATDLKAIEFLRALPNTEVRVSYDTRRTRLHAKAYLFHRRTGFGTAYVGSANISHAALSEGLEWNVKVSQYESVHLWDKVRATFEGYWEDHKDFHLYSTDEDKDRLRTALRDERTTGADQVLFPFDLQPYPFQQEILTRLAVERDIHNRYRNLIVAATGTGKTVVAAFDYRRVKEAASAAKARPPRLLFVAHRREILEQSLACFRAVLRNANFGELLVGSYEPTQDDHLFASIQSINSRGLMTRLTRDHFDYIVIDETHRSAADSYQSLLDHFRPHILLGLTATPERMDGDDILTYFDNHISAEIRLPEAINRKLLCPFQYFGVTDNTVDYRSLSWTNGGYQVRELEERYTGNLARLDTIVRAVRDRLLDVRDARGLGFCVSVNHAEYMAAEFNRLGIPSEALSGQSTDEKRRTVQQRLVNREINFIFVVDLYNEGVDMPELDTVLFLRPTESLTVFLQQLGRGLRLAEGKECLTVLDFIGQAHRSYNFEARYRALLSNAERRVDKEIADGFPHVPAGCVVQLEKVAESYVLDNIRAALTQSSKTRWVQRIASFRNETGKPVSLAGFLNHYELSLDTMYSKASWSRLCVDARVCPDFIDPDEPVWSRGLRRVGRMNGATNLRTLIRLLETDGGDVGPDSEVDPIIARTLLMLHFSLWGVKANHPAAIQGILAKVDAHPQLHAELLEMLRCRYDQLTTLTRQIPLPFPCPLELHADYTRDQILAGVGFWTLGSHRGVREGVLYVKDTKTDILLNTLNKTEDHYSPSTMYQDYAISENLFHWQSQSTTSSESATGRRYIRQDDDATVLLFVRENRDASGIAAPYTFLGPVRYVRHEGSRPMSIEWRLHYPMPGHLVDRTR